VPQADVILKKRHRQVPASLAVSGGQSDFHSTEKTGTPPAIHFRLLPENKIAAGIPVSPASMPGSLGLLSARHRVPGKPGRLK
jgi:hypothetical protein